MHAIHANIHSIRTKFTLLTLGAVLVTLSIATVIAMISIVKLGRKDAEQMIHLTCTTGALNLESYFNSVYFTTPPRELQGQRTRIPRFSRIPPFCGSCPCPPCKNAQRACWGHPEAPLLRHRCPRRPCWTVPV